MEIRDNSTQLANTESTVGFCSTLQCVLNSFSVAVILIKSGGGISCTNAAADSLIQSKEWLYLADHRLRCQGSCGLELEHQIHHTASFGYENSDNMILLTSPDKTDSLIAAITPLSPDNRISTEIFEAVMCVIIDPERAFRTNDTFLQQVYALTDAEVNITSLLAQGLNYAQIAEHRNVAVATIRSYTKSIFKKLKVNSRAEVVRKVYAAMIPVIPINP